MKPELKLGRPVIAWNDSDPQEYAGTFISNSSKGNWVLLDGANTPASFDNVKPDLTAEPMNGDEVEVSDDKKHWHSPRLYVGKTKDGRHFTGGDFNCDVSSWNHVRFSQQSKRDRVLKLLYKPTLYCMPELADQIDKIYTEDL